MHGTTDGAKRRTYLIQDPYHEDAIQFIQTIFMYFGLRPVCFYTDRKLRFYGEALFPVLQGDMIEDRYDVSLDDLATFCDEVSHRYEVLGVVPYIEVTVEVAAQLCGLLGLEWNDEVTLARFRDKHQLKTFVAEVDPSVRVPQHRLVQNVQDVWNGPTPERFVIKPNDGVGNQRIGIFDAQERDAVAAHVQSEPPTTWILEEFIGGTEFHVDGQIRRDGELTILGVFEYIRTTVNNYSTVYSGEVQCRTSHPLFDEITSYALRLLTATGLRSCPFHLELKVDENGPCLVDLGARFASEGGARTLSRLHPYRADAFAVAAHDYLGADHFAREPLNFEHYDSEVTVIAYGISYDEAIVESLEGLEKVEARPEFVGWALKPRVGDRVTVTEELLGAPYIVEFRHSGDDSDAAKLIDFVHETVKWNHRKTPTRRVTARIRHLIRRGLPKLRWVMRDGLKSLGE